MKLDEKTVLVTGASTGIGREVACRLSRRKCRLVLVARRGDLLEELIGSFPSHPQGHRWYACDVADFDRVKSVCTDILAQGIEPDVLLLNAGVGTVVSPMDLDVGQFRHQFEVNYFGVVYFLKFLLPPMVNRGSGLVVATGSLAGYRGMPGFASYSGSKAALAILIESLRIDLWKRGVKFVLLSPGFVKTPMTDRNRFPMPFLIPVEKAARIIIRGMEREKPEIHFPLRLSLLVKMARHLPFNLYAKIMSHMAQTDQSQLSATSTSNESSTSSASIR